MSMNYVVRKKVDKSGDKEVVRYYAASTWWGPAVATLPAATWTRGA